MKLVKIAIGGCLVFCLWGLAGIAGAQCKPGDILVGEDAHYYYCTEGASGNDIKGVARDLERIKNEGIPELLGEEWRVRRGVIDAMAYLTRTATYEFGAKMKVVCEGRESVIQMEDKCDSGAARCIDCSGSLAFSMNRSACFVGALYEASNVDIKALYGMNANDQWNFFREHRALIPKWGFPLPGDAVFFEKTQNKPGATHVATYLGKNPEGRILIISTSESKNSVRFMKILVDGDFGKKIIGYGNISKLHMNLKSGL
jgi:hypothetical protein